MLAKHMTRTAALLALFAVTGTGMVALTHEGTAEAIAKAERETLLRKLNAVIPSENYNNELIYDVIEVIDLNLLGSNKPSRVFRARLNGQPAGIILTPVAPDGYSGDIKLLLGLDYDGAITGVRVLGHRETPGLGDAIEERRSAWIFSFDKKDLSNPGAEKWKVERDGGVFDQFTGATITPRAIVKAIHKALVYYQQNRDRLYSEPKRGDEQIKEHGQ